VDVIIILLSQSAQLLRLLSAKNSCLNNVDGLILMTPTKRNSAMGTSTAYPILRRKTILDMIHKRCHNIHEIAKGFFVK